MNSTSLPPLPSSDDLSLKYNRADSFYKRTTRDFWGENKLERIPYVEKPRAPRYFVQIPGGVYDKNNGFQLLGPGLKAKDGKVFAQGKEIKFNN